MSTTLRFWLVLLVIASLGVPLALAQDATPEATAEVTETPISDLSYNSPVIGRIGGQEITQAWPLLIASADRVSVVVERVDGNLIPGVMILDAAGQEIANSFGAQPDAATAQIDSFAFPAAGEYTVQVYRDQGESGVTEGHYRLTVIPLATAADNINNTTVIGPVEIDTPIDAVLTPTHWIQRYTYNATSPDSVRITVMRTGGTLLPEVSILDANDAVLTTGYVEYVGDKAVIESFEFPTPGAYTIAVSRSNGYNGETEGDYQLVITMLGSGEGSPNLAGTAGTVEYDTPLQGEINNTRWYQDWTLTAQAGDRLRISAVRADGNLMPEVSLMGGAGQELQHGYIASTGDRGVINDYTLTAPGSYTVRVLRQYGQDGETSGFYDLTVELLGSGAGSPALAEVSGALPVNEPVDGEITHRRWADSWSFSADASLEVIFTVKRTTGTLIPTLELRDSNGQPLTSAYYEAGRDSSTLTYTFPAAGTYTVVVLRDRGQSGDTTGTYTLRAQLPPG